MTLSHQQNSVTFASVLNSQRLAKKKINEIQKAFKPLFLKLTDKVQARNGSNNTIQAKLSCTHPTLCHR